MGIEGFIRYLSKNQYLENNLNRVPTVVDSLSFDLNGVIYKSYNDLSAPGIPRSAPGRQPTRDEVIKSENWRQSKLQNPEGFIDDICDRTIENINFIINQVPKVRQVFIAVDGVAPFAKNLQQRSRRYRAVANATSQTIFDTNQISPGTAFMRRLDERIKRWMENNKNNFRFEIIYSSHMVLGEGEHKIFEAYRDNVLTGDGYHLIHGLDADFVMLALASNKPKIVLMREFVGEQLRQRERLGQSEIDYLYIDVLRENLMKKYPVPTIYFDFVVILFMVGNDFLPILLFNSDVKTPKTDPNVSTQYLIEGVLMIYRKIYDQTGKTLTENQGETINVEVLKMIFEKMANNEPKVINKYYQEYPKQSLFNELKGIIDSNHLPGFDFHIFREIYYRDEFNPKGDPRLIEDLLRQLPHLRDYLIPTPEQMENKVIDTANDYLNGLFWVQRYYKHGINAINFEWSYPLRKAPLVVDIHSFLERYQMNIKYLPYPNMVRYSILEQLLSIIPRKSIAALPNEIRGLYYPESPIYDFFPLDYRQTDTFMVFHQGKEIPILPEINPKIISDVVASLKMPAKVRAEFALQQTASGKPLYIVYGSTKFGGPATGSSILGVTGTVISNRPTAASAAKDVPKTVSQNIAEKVFLPTVRLEPLGNIEKHQNDEDKIYLEPARKIPNVALPVVKQTIPQSSSSTSTG